MHRNLGKDDIDGSVPLEYLGFYDIPPPQSAQLQRLRAPGNDAEAGARSPQSPPRQSAGLQRRRAPDNDDAEADVRSSQSPPRQSARLQKRRAPDDDDDEADVRRPSVKRVQKTRSTKQGPPPPPRAPSKPAVDTNTTIPCPCNHYMNVQCPVTFSKPNNRKRTYDHPETNSTTFWVPHS